MQIYQCVAVAGRGEILIAPCEILAKFTDHILPNFIVSTASRRADGCDDIACVSSKRCVHLLDSFPHD